MSRILITGGNGGLGKALITQLRHSGHAIRVMSRHHSSAVHEPAIEWVQANLETGEGLDAALHDVQIIAHLASSPLKNTYQTDIEGTQRLLQLCHTYQIEHLIFMSIVGVEHFPNYAYYRIKAQAERIVESSGVPFTILRTTQFHSLLDRLLNASSQLPIILLPRDARFQPIATSEAAACLAQAVLAAPAGRMPDIGGPEVLTLDGISQAWCAIRGIRKPIINLPIPGQLMSMRSFRQGLNTVPDNAIGRVTWATWLTQHYLPAGQSSASTMQ